MEARSGRLRYMGSQLFILLTHHKFLFYVNSSEFSFSIPLEAPALQAPQPKVQEYPNSRQFEDNDHSNQLGFDRYQGENEEKGSQLLEQCIEYKKGRGDCCRKTRGGRSE